MELCSKCKTNPRADEDSTNPWCNPCKTQYAKEYAAIKKEMLKQRGFAEGVSAARKHFAQKFSALGPNTFNGVQAAHWVMNEPGPAVPD